MADRVSSARPYHSPRRAAQAQATRAAILQAARQLLESQGFNATTIAAIARAATVSPATVVSVFGTKRAILEALIAGLVAGDESGLRLRQRAEWSEMLAAPDGVQLLQRYARIVRTLQERTAALIEILVQAAERDPEADVMRRQGAQRRLRDSRAVVDELQRRDLLHESWTPARAADTLWALNAPTLYRTLTNDRGWSPDEWQRWFANVSARTLLR